MASKLHHPLLARKHKRRRGTPAAVAAWQDIGLILNKLEPDDRWAVLEQLSALYLERKQTQDGPADD
jgi:hypothetical protein